MNDPPSEPPRARRYDRPAWKAFGALLVTLAVVLGARGARFLTPDCESEGCPRLRALREYTPPEAARIHDEKGSFVGQLHGPRRIVVPLEEIPEVVREGYVAVEDRRFRSHGGVDLRSALRAFAANLRSGSIAEGGSTITMQLARNLFEPEVVRWHPFRRKLAEIRIARLIEDQLGKDEILHLYLNQIYLGDGVYGVETASRHYFGKPVSSVDIREAAFLIGLAKNPEGYDPREYPAAADARIETVLHVLAERGIITREEADRARRTRLRLSSSGHTPGWGKNAYYFAAVRRELRKVVPDAAERHALRVFTGLDRDAQASAVDALLAQIRAIEEGRLGAFEHDVPGPELRGMDASPYLQGMVVAMDPTTGLVTTLVGGRDYRHSQFDRAFQGRRQPGSALAPIVYAAALGRGLRLSDRISTEPFRHAETGLAWSPSDQAQHPALSVRAALVQSSSRAAVRIGRIVGVDGLAQLARRLGLTTEIPRYPSAFLGAGEVIPVQLVAAFAAFGNGGHRVEPHLITHVVDADGVVLYRRERERGRPVLDERIAYLLLDVLQETAASGVSFPAAGKAGATNASRDVWFVGLTPSLVAGVWLGFDTPRTILAGGDGGKLAAPVWSSFMRSVNGRRGAVSSWAAPPGVVAIEIDARTGLRPSADCPATATTRELFLEGAGPSNGCRSGAVSRARSAGSTVRRLVPRPMRPPAPARPAPTPRAAEVGPQRSPEGSPPGATDPPARPPQDSLAPDSLGQDVRGLDSLRHDSIGTDSLGPDSVAVPWVPDSTRARPVTPGVSTGHP